MKTNISKIMKNGKAMFLAYDQGLEHGPVEFNDENVDPRYILEIAKKGKFNAIIFQKGIAEKYNKEIKNSPLMFPASRTVSVTSNFPKSRT